MTKATLRFLAAATLALTGCAADTGCALPCPERMANAGFSKVRWCHRCRDDSVYAESEGREIAR